MKSKQSVPSYYSVLVLLLFIVSPFILPFIYGFIWQIENYIRIKFLIELATFLFLVCLVYSYKKSLDDFKRSMILSIIIGTSTAFLVMYGFLLIWFTNNSFEFTNKGYEMEEEFSKNQNIYIPLVTQIFDKAKFVNVRADIDKMYGKMLDYPYVTDSSGTVYVTSRKPVYFIRLKNNRIEKLFQSGDIKYETIDTKGEREVEKMLLGKLNPIIFPQHTCCGGNDLPWNEVPFFRLFIPERRYLKDFNSELETILLIRDNNGSILGAMVDLHGD